jgi:alkanesulfonate monooxygenase SsuD/methylene tetrahydromethanopterin reductase-like flavin-dependent oxidoreductase (luciferase family)
MNMEVGLFMGPTIAPLSELKKGLAGRRTDLYQTMLEHLVEIAQLADSHGYYGIGFTEHHLGVEGLTVSNSPQMLSLYLAERTTTIRFGPMGNVLPAANPLRLASEIAMLDQMTQGRAFAGFTRGVQARWLNTLAQHTCSLADNMTSPQRYDDDRKRLFAENLAIIKKAWECDTFSHKGEYWTIPNSTTKWLGRKLTTEMGGRSMDSEGRLLEVGVVPALYNRKRPTLFEPFSVSAKTVELAASNGMIPIGVVCDQAMIAEQLRGAQIGWEKAGVHTKIGEKTGFARYMFVADTDAEALEVASHGLFEWFHYFSQFGYKGAVANAGEDVAKIPDTVEELVRRGLVYCGSPDSVNRQLEAARKYIPVDYLWLITPNEITPHAQMIKSLDLAARKVFPNFTDKVGPNARKREAELAV